MHSWVISIGDDDNDDDDQANQGFTVVAET